MIRHNTQFGPKYRYDHKILDAAVVVEDKYYLIPMSSWNTFSEDIEELICVHNCDNTSQQPFFVSWNIDDTCPYCKSIAPERIQTLYILHNGHY